MKNVLSLLEILIPIVVCLGLGMLARSKEMLTQEQNRGVQQFVLKFCIPCVLFNSCLQAQIGPQNLTTMAMLLPVSWAAKSMGRL